MAVPGLQRPSRARMDASRGTAHASDRQHRLRRRRAVPRVSVSAGAVGIGGAQTGVYPCKTPGGWQIIGQTPLRLYEAGREMPALLAAGDWVKFVPISAEEFYKLQANGMESERLQSLVSSHSYMML